MNTSTREKWVVLLADLGHPHASSWDDKTFNTALFRGSKEKQELLKFLAPIILECSGRTEKFPEDVDLLDVYSKFIFLYDKEFSLFNPSAGVSSLLKDKQIEIWNNIFWKIDAFRNKTGNASQTGSVEDQELASRCIQALFKAEEILNKPLPKIIHEASPVDVGKVVTQDELIRSLSNYLEEAKRFKMDPGSGNLDVNLSTLRTLSEIKF